MELMTRQRKGRRRYRGAALAEAAIIMALLMMVTLGAIEYGWLFLKAQQLTNATRQAARIAILPDTGAQTRAAAALEEMLTRANLWAEVSNGPNFFTYTDLPVGADVVHEVTVRVQVSTANLRIAKATFLPAPAHITCVVTMAREGG